MRVFSIWACPVSDISSKGVATLVHSLLKLEKLQKLSLAWRYHSNAAINELQILERRLLMKNKLIELDYSGVEKIQSSQEVSRFRKILNIILIVFGPLYFGRLIFGLIKKLKFLAIKRATII
jgi:hypothetical protein